MVYCEIKECLPHNVYVLSGANKYFEMIFEFYGLVSPEVGDCLVVHEKLLDKNSPQYIQPYSFEISDKEIKNEEELNAEVALLKTSGKIYVLKRIYG